MTYREGLASLAFRARWARGFLWLFFATVAAGIPIRIWVEYSNYEPFASYGLIWAVSLIYDALVIGAILGCVVAIPAWTHRAWTNLYVLGLAGLRRSPAWATASYFIPVVGLFLPFTAMRELFNRSTGEDEDQAKASVPDVTSWWACYIAGAFVVAFLMLTALFNTNGLVFIVTPQIMTQALTAFANLLLVGSSWFLLKIIRDITAAQNSSAGITETFA